MSKKSITVLLTMGMAFSVLADVHNKVQLWKDGPYWADTNIGAEKPWEYGYYFWWGDTVGYKRVNDAWVASDGSSSGFSFSSNMPTCNRTAASLLSEGWITADKILTSEHDAAHVQWGGGWRMPTWQELNGLNRKCDWTWTETNGVSGYVVRGRDDYASASIFLPCAGFCLWTSLCDVGSCGIYWSSDLSGSNNHSEGLNFKSSNHDMYAGSRNAGFQIRPVQGFER